MCCFMSYRGSKGDGSTYLGNNNVIMIIITPIMHSTAGYGGWFTPMMYHAHCTWVGLRLGHVHTTNKPHLRTSFNPHPSAIDHTRVRFNWTKKKNAPRMGGQRERKEEGDTAPLKAPSSGFITALSAPPSPSAGRCLHEAVCFLRVWRARLGDECMIQRVGQSWLVHITYLGGCVY